MTRHVYCLTVLLSALVLIRGDAAAQDAEPAPRPIEIHFSHMLAEGGQWRTPNEDYDPDNPNSPELYGANYRLSDDGSHVIAEVTGISPDGRSARYWTIYLFHNPVTDEIVSTQIGWNGTYMEGHGPAHPTPLLVGDAETSDQLIFGIDGSVSILRHEITVTGPDTHTTQTYVRGENGAWTPQNFRTWTLAPAE